MSGIPNDIIEQARNIIETFRERKKLLATAESCTGGLIAAAITEVAGSSDVFDRGFVTYSNAAKIAMLDVSPEDLKKYGAVSVEAASQMALGAIANSEASVAISVTGVAGPGGGSVKKPVGHVCFGVADRQGRIEIRVKDFGPLTRTEIRFQSVRFAFDLVSQFV